MIPIIDFRSKTCIEEMHRAYTTCGFAIFTNVYDNWLSEFTDWKELMEEFFQLPLDTKKQYQYSGVRGSLTCRAGWGEMGYIQNRSGDLKESITGLIQQECKINTGRQRFQSSNHPLNRSFRSLNNFLISFSTSSKACSNSKKNI